MGLIFVHPKLLLQDHDHELARGVIVIDENDLVKARLFRF
jgi:hypothetical protein